MRKITYKYIRNERKPGELLEIDVKYVPGKIANKRYFQFTAIDTASRWRYLKVYEEQSNYHSVLFLEEAIERFKHKIQAVKQTMDLCSPIDTSVRTREAIFLLEPCTLLTKFAPNTISSIT